MRETPQPTTSSPAGPPHDHTPGASAPLPPSTEIDTIRQSSTRLYRNSCPPARAREASPAGCSGILKRVCARPRARGVPLRTPWRARPREVSPPVIPAKAGILSLGMDCPGRSGLDVSLGVAVP